jgi:hypothetical protein
MLDVHPPHEAAHSWKDFFIHVGTICVGLLIAIGLEQTVEYFHHRHEIREAREALKQELEENSKLFTANVAAYRWDRAMLRNNLKVLLYLQQHPGTPEEKLPGILNWLPGYYPVVDSAWKNVQQTQILSMFPRPEAEDLAAFYDRLNATNALAIDYCKDNVRLGAYAAVDPNPSHLKPAQLDKLIEATTVVLDENLEWGLFLFTVSRDYPDFHGGITFAEIAKENGSTRNPEDDQKLAAAQAQTQQSLAAANAAFAAARKATGLH